MNRWTARMTLIALAAVTVAAIPDPGAAQQVAVDMWKPSYTWGRDIQSPSARARMQRHWTYMYDGVPIAYRDAKPTVPASPARIAAGRELYRAHCAACHRMDGMGGGDAALGLAPSPALLAFLIKRPGAADEYLLWAVSDGGALFGTSMPAFRETLAQDDIWKIIAFLRAGFPEAGTAPTR